jgi:hypothetical protein
MKRIIPFGLILFFTGFATTMGFGQSDILSEITITTDKNTYEPGVAGILVKSYSTAMYLFGTATTSSNNGGLYT